MILNVIKTESQYKEYLKEIERLVRLDPKPDTPDGKRLELLAVLAEAYEEEKYPILAPAPVEAILFRMEEQGLQQKDLVPYFGSKSRVSEVLSGKRPLTVKMIRDLSVGLGIPASVLVGEHAPNAVTEEADWESYPIEEMRKRGWFSALEGRGRSSRELLHSFFEKVGGRDRQVVFLRKTIHFGGIDTIDTRALNAWLARVIIRSREEQVSRGRYQRVENPTEFLSEVARLSWFSNGPILAKEFLQKKGIALVLEPHLPKTRLDGATTSDRDGTPVIGLTLRHDRVDNFWYTLLHELVHLFMHLQSQDEAYVDDTEIEGDEDQKEMEANRMARDAFVPRRIWQRSDAYRLQTIEAIKSLADELRIHPAIVAGRIRKETGNYRLFSNVVGSGAVRKLFPEWRRA